MTPSVQQITKLAKWGKAPLKWTLPKTIESKNLGWIRPDGKINFQTEDVAMEYAKNRAVGALKQAKSFERAIFVKGNVILSDIDGLAHGVHFDSKKILSCDKNVVLVHGHPTNTPLSNIDYACLIANDNLKSVIAYNKRGEFSKMTKVKESFFIRLLPKTLYEYLKMCRIMHADEQFKKIKSNEFKELVKRIKSLKISSKDMSKENLLATAEWQSVADYAKQVLTKMNNIWAKNEKMYGIKYETNYSKLV